MRKILQTLLAIFIVLALNSQFFVSSSSAAWDSNSYTTFRNVDKNSFNEYRYLITKEFLWVKSSWDVDWVLDKGYLLRIKDLALRGYNYLPDNNLENENALNNLNIAIERWLKYEWSEAAYIGLIKSISVYLDETSIESITWEVKALPESWNAPFNVTMRTDIIDPTWTNIPKYNYTWWMNVGSRKVNIGTWPSINYTFKEEWNYTVFVSVKSAHKNSKWYTDVIPFEDKVEIKVREKVASLIIKVNGDRLWNRESLKFTPSQAKYGLLFDATNSIPTWSARFIRTEWDFDNGTKKSYSWEPKVERIVYNKEWDYEVKLTLKTNLWKTIEKEFIISIHDPIATIDVSPSEWFLGDKFTISAKNVINDTNITYNWTIVDIIEDKVVFSKQTKLFTYNFPNKWHFNIKLEVDWIESGTSNIDTKNVYINSRAPVANFSSSVPESNKPNRILLDATDSFDPDFTDTWKLKYYWEIDWARVNLEDANENGSLGYYTFSTIWDHNVVLEVEDPDNIKWIKKDKINVNSVLSLDFSANPRAIKRWESIEFEAISPNANFYEWDFGDNNIKKWWIEDKLSHKYEKTGIFEVKLKVIDEAWKSNTHKKVIYVWNWEEPVAILNVSSTKNNTSIEKNACNWEDAYTIDRITSLNIDAWDSIDIDWNSSSLDYSIKIWNDKYFTSRTVNHKFDEIWCFPVILKVTSQTNYATDSKKIWVKVKNISPSLSSLTTRVESLETDPVIVTVDAIWATDKDWVITSYLWYYYTDLDDEAQGFRSTVGPSTKFVLPKITWNYYFVVLLSDDSETRVSSKELWKNSSLTLAWNNINVPILELKVPDNSVAVFDEVVFNAKVQNILKQDISKKVNYFWDFDWDWFYDLETKLPSVTHTYDNPWTYYSKLKVKHKGFSNTRNVEINVANSLVPNFDYLSIWNKFIFINKTTWAYENVSFDLWDWTVEKDKDYFEHNYKDWKSSHIIKLTASDSNTVKKSEKKVVKNIDNLFKSKKDSDWIIFSIPNSDSSNIVEIEKQTETISFYFSWNKNTFSEILADINLEKDSDLNGWKDDDLDTSSKDTYLNVKLNKNREQLVRVYVNDNDWNVIKSKDYKIIKKYLKESEIDLWEIEFIWVSEFEKQKLEELKELVSSISWEDLKIAKTYVARLKDEWNDENERTKIIYEFDWFLNDSTIQNKDEIIVKLQELLLKENDESNLKNIALRALQWSTPENIECKYPTDYKSCKEYIDSSLETIRYNDDIDQNKELWAIILNIIWSDTSLTTEQKLNYKATLQNLIYGWVENIPDDKREEIIWESEDSDSSIISSILKYVLYIFLWALWLIGLWIAWYFIYFKLVNKDGDKNFEDFVSEKTDNIEDKKEIKETKKDIFAPYIKEIKKEENIIKEDKNDIFSDIKKEEKTEIKTETKQEDVPDWLKGNFDDNKETKKTETKFEPKEEDKKTINNKKIDKKEEKIEKKESNDIPDWLKWTVDETDTKKDNKDIKQEKLVDSKKTEDKSISKIEKTEKKENKQESIEEVTKIEDKDVPDWLKWSLDKEKSEKKEEEKSEKKENKDIPDWLKWSLDEEKSEKKEEESISPIKDDKKEEKLQEVQKEIKQEERTEKKKVKDSSEKSSRKTKKKNTKTVKEDKKTIKEEKKEDLKTEDKKEKKDIKKKESDKKTEAEKVSNKTDKSKKDAKTSKESSDLWDDGMDVPDWLKS